jgi:hypothetical protein
MPIEQDLCRASRVSVVGRLLLVEMRRSRDRLNRGFPPFVRSGLNGEVAHCSHPVGEAFSVGTDIPRGPRRGGFLASIAPAGQ